MKRGGDFLVFDLDFGRIGILTCYDGWFPETFRILSLKGAEVLVWINGRRGTVEDFIVKSAMYQDEVALIATNQAYGAGTMIGQWPAQILASCNGTERELHHRHNQPRAGSSGQEEQQEYPATAAQAIRGDRQAASPIYAAIFLSSFNARTLTLL